MAKAAPDGYNIALLTTSSAVLNVFLYHKLNFDIRQDRVAVAEVGRSPSVMTARPGLASHFAELKAAALAAKAQGRDLTFGSGGNGTGPHLAGTMLARILGVEMTHVPYRGSGPALTALLSGQIDLLIEAVPVQFGQIQEGGVKPILVAARQRDALLPQVPTAAEAGASDLEIENSYGIFAPAKTPAPVLQTLAEALRKGLADPACGKRLTELGITGGRQDPEGFGAYWRSELQRWEPIVAASGAKVD
ncbi:MAG: putative exported protein [Roseomonas sp.]|nr:putative exported protein [Roseomonas sp.]